MKFEKRLIMITIFSLLCFDALCIKKNMRGDPVETKTEVKDTTPEKPFEPPIKPDVTEIWEDLFTAARGTSCGPTINKANLLSQIRAEEDRKFQNKEQGGDGELVESDSDFAWIEKWGFGPVAYLFDFLDVIFQKEVVAEFKAIHNATISQSPENLPEYSDPFDYAGKLSTAPPALQGDLIKSLKKFEKHYNPTEWAESANAVQIFQVMRETNWASTLEGGELATEFVSRFDINKDGRLNHKELILGSIVFNKHTLGSKKCTHCYAIANKLKALFSYLDCGETGFVSADQLWKGLPDLKRQAKTYDIFAIGQNENIRTDAINDFILKNKHAKDASVSKDEFVQGILLGYWDRQVTENAIIEDDSRNLKALRWVDGGVRDKTAEKYVKEMEKEKIRQEEQEAYMKWQRAQEIKLQKAKQEQEAHAKQGIVSQEE